MSKDIGQLFRIMSVSVTSNGGVELVVKNISSSAVKLGLLSCIDHMIDGTFHNSAFWFCATLEKGEMTRSISHSIDNVDHIDLISLNGVPVRKVLRKIGYFQRWKLEDN